MYIHTHMYENRYSCICVRLFLFVGTCICMCLRAHIQVVRRDNSQLQRDILKALIKTMVQVKNPKSRLATQITTQNDY